MLCSVMRDEIFSAKTKVASVVVTRFYENEIKREGKRKGFNIYTSQDVPLGDSKCGRWQRVELKSGWVSIDWISRADLGMGFELDISL